jgi:hypothetical protein
MRHAYSKKILSRSFFSLSITAMDKEPDALNDVLMIDMLVQIHRALDACSRARMRLACRAWHAADPLFVSPSWTYDHPDLPHLNVKARPLWKHFLRGLAEFQWILPRPERLQYVARFYPYGRDRSLCIQWPEDVTVKGHVFFHYWNWLWLHPWEHGDNIHYNLGRSHDDMDSCGVGYMGTRLDERLLYDLREIANVEIGRNLPCPHWMVVRGFVGEEDFFVWDANGQDQIPFILYTLFSHPHHWGGTEELDFIALNKASGSFSSSCSTFTKCSIASGVWFGKRARNLGFLTSIESAISPSTRSNCFGSRSASLHSLNLFSIMISITPSDESL